MSFPISGGVPSGPGLDPAADEAADQHTPPHPFPLSHASDAWDSASASAPASAVASSLASSSASSPVSASVGTIGGLSTLPLGPVSQQGAAPALDLSRSVFFTSDLPLRTFLLTDPASLVQQQLDHALERLLNVLPAPGQEARLRVALDRLKEGMRVSDERQEQMLGCGKRWLTRLLELLESPQTVTLADRATICDDLIQALVSDSMGPAKALGTALDAVWTHIPGGGDANGFRALLHQRTLSMLVGQSPVSSQRGQPQRSPEDQVSALLDGFGFTYGQPRPRRPVFTVSAADLNRAADVLENRLQTQIFPVAHDILNRFNICFETALKQPCPAEEPLTPEHQDIARRAIKLVQSPLRINLIDYLCRSGSGPMGTWLLNSTAQLEARIREALPELSRRPASPALPAPHPVVAAPGAGAGHPDAALSADADADGGGLVTLPPPWERTPSAWSSDSSSAENSSVNSSPELRSRALADQDSGSGATGTFNAGTGGASRRGPT